MSVLCLQPTRFDFIERGHFRAIDERARAMDLFRGSVTMVELEVFSYCNRRCWFCPNSTIDRRSENHLMAPGLYSSILEELAEIDYSGAISYSRYNEPLADRIILDRLREAHRILPKATLHTNTNGDYLRPDYLEQLYESGLRSLNIQAYLGNNDPYDHERIRKRIERTAGILSLPVVPVRDEVGSWLEVRLEYRDMAIRLYGRNFEVNGCNRGEEVPIAATQPRVSPCLSPFYHLYVDFNGCVMPCCNLRSDVPQHAGYVIADLSREPGIFRAFASDNAARWRRSLIGFGEKGGVCRSCRFVEFEPSADNLQKNEGLLLLSEPG